MQVRAVALYPQRLSTLAGKPGVRFRKSKKKSTSTLVPCRIEHTAGRSVAVPEFDVPPGTPSPLFKAQLAVTRVSVDQRRIVCVVLGEEALEGRTDPEQAILLPIFDDGKTMLYEFRRALILTLGDRSDLELRMVVVHPVQGTIGTKTIHRFNTRFMSLAGRCSEYLAGAVDMFPPPPRYIPNAFKTVPEGEANLTFEPRGKPRTPTT